MIITKKKNLFSAIYENGLHKVKGSPLGHKLSSQAKVRLDPRTAKYTQIR